MPSNAISAQDSILRISTGTGSPKNITAIQLGNPTILTSAAHGFSAGDVVTLAAIGGTTVLNGQAFVVRNVTANTFAIDYNTLGGTAYTSGGTATPVAFTEINEIKSFSGFDGQASEIDVTNLRSTAKEFRLGLTDSGGFTFEMNQVNADPGQAALRATKNAGTIKTYVLELPNGETATFDAFAKGFPTAGGVDGVVTSAIALRISGPVVWA